MTWDWFNGKTVRSFWSPILDVNEAWFRDSHILAHVLGGVLWAFCFRFVVLATPEMILLDLRSSSWLRLLAVAVWQGTMWELVQKENWRPLLHGLPEGHGYPWLSAIWDVLFTLAGAACFELLWWVL